MLSTGRILVLTFLILSEEVSIVLSKVRLDVDDTSTGKESESPSEMRSPTLYFPASSKILRLPRTWVRLTCNCFTC